MRNRLALGALAIAATLIGSGSALAQECPTPEQMRAELAEAIRTGDLVVVFGSDANQKARELFGSPDRPRPAAGRAGGPAKAESYHAARIDPPSPPDPRVDYDRLLPFGE
jgi:hypothetical protein